MATCTPSTLLESAKCFSCLSKKELQAVVAQLLCNISVDGVPTDIDALVSVNVLVPFTLVSGTTDDVSYDLGIQPIGWHTLAYNYIINQTPAAWGGAAAQLAFTLYYDIETNVGLTDELSAYTGDLPAGIPPGGNGSGSSIAQPLYFQHAQAPSMAVYWNVQPNIGETVGGFIRLYLKRETTT